MSKKPVKNYEVSVLFKVKADSPERAQALVSHVLKDALELHTPRPKAASATESVRYTGRSSATVKP